MACPARSDAIELQPAAAAAGQKPADGRSSPASQAGVSPPATAVPVVEKWNSSSTNVCRLLATFWAFMVIGANDAAYGGFFLGPLFPAAVVATTKLLPAHLHVPAIGFAAALGGSGAAIFPFAIGVLAQARGVQVLQPVIVALLAALLAVWSLMPRMQKAAKKADDDAEGGRAEDGPGVGSASLGEKLGERSGPGYGRGGVAA